MRRYLGIAALVCAVLLFMRRLPKLREQIRPVYERLGILEPPPSSTPTSPPLEEAGE